MRKLAKASWVVAGSIAFLAVAFIAPHAGAFDYEQYNKDKAAQVSKDLQEAMNRTIITPNVQTDHHPIPKPAFKVGRVQPEANGTYQISLIDHGPVKVDDLWTKDLKPDATQEVWNEDTIYTGVLRANTNQGVISEWVINTGVFHQWKIPGNSGGSVTIESIKGDVVSYKTANESGTLNTSNGKFSK